MDVSVSIARDIELFLREVAALAPDLRAGAEELDKSATFPAAAFERLQDIGCLRAPVPVAYGGLGVGTDAAGWQAAVRLLRLLGAANLAVARIFEAHLNALRLILLYGNEAQNRRAAEAAQQGKLFALWVTDGVEPLRIDGLLGKGRLVGAKNFCSAAGHADQALVTAHADEEIYLLLITTDFARRSERVGPPPQGMRAAATGQMQLTGTPISEASIIGQAGDYLREPEFSAGAWRTCAAHLGGLDALTGELRNQLISRGRDSHPHQLARFGQAAIARETAAMWVFRAARIAHEPGWADGDRHAYVNLARTAVERCCIEALQLAQRSLGLAAFVPPNPVERLSRDLATYLRQPAPDEALADAATWFMRHELPSFEGVFA